jgi:HEAT repeat protein
MDSIEAAFPEHPDSAPEGQGSAGRLGPAHVFSSPTGTDPHLAVLADLSAASQDRIQALMVLSEKLRKMPNAASILCLLTLLKQDTDALLVTHCISVLGRLQAYSAVSLLVDAAQGQRIQIFQQKNSTNGSFRLTESGIRLRTAAIQALGRIGDHAAILPLMNLLKTRNENYRIRLAAAESLGRLGDEDAIPSLLGILSDDRESSLYLKESAAKALGMLGDIRAIEPLIDILESKRNLRDKFNFVKEQIIHAIGRIGKPHRKALDTLTEALDDEAPSIRLAAVEALAALGDPDGIGHLKGKLWDKDDAVARAAVTALASLGGEGLIADLLALENLPMFLRAELEAYL